MCLSLFYDLTGVYPGECSMRAWEECVFFLNVYVNFFIRFGNFLNVISLGILRAFSAYFFLFLRLDHFSWPLFKVIDWFLLPAQICCWAPAVNFSIILLFNSRTALCSFLWFLLLYWYSLVRNHSPTSLQFFFLDILKTREYV